MKISNPADASVMSHTTPAKIGDGLTGAPIIRINKRKKEANFSTMVLSTSLDERSDMDEHVFPPYQEKNTINVDNTNSTNTRNRSLANGKQRFDQTNSHGV